MNDWRNEVEGERMDDRTSERTKSRRIDERAYEQDNEKSERWTNGQTDERTNGRMKYVPKCYLIEIILTSFKPRTPEYVLMICNIRTIYSFE